LARLAKAVAAGGDHDRATVLAYLVETVARQITEPGIRGVLLTDLAATVVVTGDHDWVVRLVDEAERLSWQAHPIERVWVLALLAETVADGGYHDRAEALTRQITDPHRRVSTLAKIAAVAAVSGDHGRATRLATEAETLAGQITDLDDEAWAGTLPGLVTAAAVSGDYERAEALIGEIASPEWLAKALAGFARVIAETDDQRSPIPENAHSNALMMSPARNLLSKAPVVSSWISSVSALARVDPTALSALADELQVRWGLDVPDVPV
jgi:hypothetical protein